MVVVLDEHHLHYYQGGFQCWVDLEMAPNNRRFSGRFLMIYSCGASGEKKKKKKEF
jgi:hypothetical protein